MHKTNSTVLRNKISASSKTLLIETLKKIEPGTAEELRVWLSRHEKINNFFGVSGPSKIYSMGDN